MKHQDIYCFYSDPIVFMKHNLKTWIGTRGTYD